MLLLRYLITMMERVNYTVYWIGRTADFVPFIKSIKSRDGYRRVTLGWVSGVRVVFCTYTFWWGSGPVSVKVDTGSLKVMYHVVHY